MACRRCSTVVRTVATCSPKASAKRLSAASCASRAACDCCASDCVACCNDCATSCCIAASWVRKESICSFCVRAVALLRQQRLLEQRQRLRAPGACRAVLHLGAQLARFALGVVAQRSRKPSAPRGRISSSTISTRFSAASATSNQIIHSGMARL